MLLDAASGGDALGILADNAPESYITASSGSIILSGGTAPLSSTKFNILQAIYNTSSSEYDVFTPATSVGTNNPTKTATGTVGSTSPNGITVGGRANGSGLSNINVIGIYVWSGALSLTDLDEVVEGYIKPKWLL